MLPRLVLRSQRLLITRRVFTCVLAVFAGLVAAAALLRAAAGPVRRAYAAPLADTIIVTTSIQAAIDAAQPGDTVFVPAGTYTESLTLNKAVSLSGELSATTIIHAIASQRVLTVTGAAVDSSVVISGLTFTGGNVTGDGGGISVAGNAQPRLENLIVAGNQASEFGGGLGVEAGSPLHLINVAVLSNTTSFATAGMHTPDALAITGGTFQGNECSQSCIGGGLFAGSYLTLTHVDFINNTSRGHAGGGAYAFGRVIVEGGLFQGNQCLDNCLYGGGGLHTPSTAQVSGTQFVSNTATHSGGGLMVIGPYAWVEGALFQGNSCSQADCTGGGIAFNNYLWMTDTQVLSNTANLYGGGIWGADPSLRDSLFQGNACLQAHCAGGGAYVGRLNITNTQFISNSALGQGGGAQGWVTIMEGGLFQSNQCSQDACQGGGLYVGNSAALSGTKFITNTAALGGGLAAQGALTLTGTLFEGNSAQLAGGGVSGLTVTVTGGRFEHNTVAHGSGGGVEAAGPLVISGTEFISNTADWEGGGLRVYGSAAVTEARFEGNHADHAGGLLAFGDLMLFESVFLSNTTSGIGGGGAGAAAAGGGPATKTVTVISSLFQANVCPNLCVGGGLLVAADYGVISDTDFIANQGHLGAGLAVGFDIDGQVWGGRFTDNVAAGAGGGLYAPVGLTVTGAQFVSNTAQANGGGLSADSALTLTNTLFEGNSAQFAGGGIYAVGAAAVDGGLFQGNACLAAACPGGGLHANTLALTGTQLINNYAEGSGGGLFHAGNTGRLVNVLFAGNSSGSGMALASHGSLVILHTTIASPTVASGSAIAVLGGTTGITNSVIANYTAGIEHLGGSVWEDYNLFAGVTTTATGVVSSGGHSLHGPAAFINPVGGDYRLGPASAAINAGTDAGLTVDFEGNVRPQHGGFDAGYDEAALDIELVISKSDGETQVPAGALLTYTIVITNSGADPATDAMVSDSVPAGLTGAAWACAAAAGSSCPASGTGDLNAAVTIGAGSALTFTLQATTTANISNPVVNTATVTVLNSTFSASDATIVSSQVALTISKTDGLTETVAGLPLTYMIVLANTGPDAAVGVMVSDSLPTGLGVGAWTCTAVGASNCPASGSGDLSASVTVASGGALTFTVTATPTTGVTQTITNTASFSLPPHVTNTAPGPASATDTTEVVVAVEYKVYLPLMRR